MGEPPGRPVSRRFDTACAETAGIPGPDGIYVGPLWEIPSRPPASGVLGWKRSVLRRREGRGAENWGHLFLLVSSEGTNPRVGTIPDGLPTGGDDRVAREGPSVLETGPPRVLLYWQANQERFAPDLRAFAARVVTRFRQGP